jgi:hypothetical protein
MPKFIDLTGHKYNFWTVMHKGEKTKDRSFFWICKCDCGTVSDVRSNHLRNGASKCCGCKGNERLIQRSIGNKHGLKHGLADHPLRGIWKAMISRCYNDKNKYYKNYGGRGIRVCDEWKNDLVAFYNWSISNGWVKRLSIDRKDNNNHYTPNNCQWITISENSRKNCILGKEVRRGRKKNTPPT